MKKKILVLDNYDSFTYNLVHYIESSGAFEVDVFRNDEICINKISIYDVFVLSPGPGLPQDSGIMLSLIEKYGSEKPILGVCLGMQAIGECFGAKLENMETTYHGIADSIFIKDQSDILFSQLPQSFVVGRYHSWCLSSLNFPSSLIVTSIDGYGTIMSIRHRDYPIYGVQFHPESILSEHGQAIIDNFLNHALKTITDRKERSAML
ncbi:anthranilate synthase component II [Brumimicrobium salinarum]|uniref:anthranilate synthase component II n=1 Tax=Brumimicrobium salinarum TaxID=2058658 RepID=UPI001F0C4145|nr:aminodeoxychorismate/anthranilate synthase component II [Brumimicrobium salinarum]